MNEQVLKSTKRVVGLSRDLYEYEQRLGELQDQLDAHVELFSRDLELSVKYSCSTYLPKSSQRFSQAANDLKKLIKEQVLENIKFDIACIENKINEVLQELGELVVT